MKTLSSISLVIIFTSLTYFCISCDEPENPDPQQTELVFESLIADKDSIDVGEAITFTATATGEDIVFEWIASAGVLLGSGNKVTYTPSPCIFGDILITCTVRDANNLTKTKEKNVFVREL